MIFNIVDFNPKCLQGLLTINFIHSEMLYMFQTNPPNAATQSKLNQNNHLYWKLPNNNSEHDFKLESRSISDEIALCMTVCPENDKMVIGYDSNKIKVFDIYNKCFHSWTKQNDNLFPENFLSRYNRLIGVTALSATKFLFYSNYTYTILDLTQSLASLSTSDEQSAVKII